MYQHQSQGPGREGLLEGSHSITRLQGRTGRKRNEVATYSFHLQGQVGGQLWAQLNKHPLSSIFSMHPTPQKEKKRVFLTRVRKKGVILVVAEEAEGREPHWGHASGPSPSPATCASTAKPIPGALRDNRIWKIFMRLHLSCSTQHILQNDVFVISNTLVNRVAQQPWEWPAYP